MKYFTYLSTLLLATTSLTMFGAHAGTIYKVVDQKTGQVTFTDRPSAYQKDKSNQVTDTHIQTSAINNILLNPRAGSQPTSLNSAPLNSAPTVSAPKSSIRQAQRSSPKKMQTDSKPSDYQLSIRLPEGERAYRRPAQTIDVKIAVSPALKSGDKIAIYLDDIEVAQGQSATIASIDLLPGEHQLTATIANANGEIINKASQTIYIIQNTPILQHKQRLTKQHQAYQSLPWHKKMLLKLRQNNLPASASPKSTDVDNTNPSNDSQAAIKTKQAVSSAFD